MRQRKFLPEDFDILLEKIAELEAKIIECGKALGGATEQSSETWHDNATYDVAKMNFEITARELQKLIEVRNSAQIIQPAPDMTEPSSAQGYGRAQQVILGSIVTILNEKTGEMQRVKVTGDTIK